MNVIDLFAGAGGLSKGFEQAGFKIIWSIDNNEKAKVTFEKNHNCNMTVEDIRKINPEEDLDISPEEVDVIIGGPPCPTFSVVGRTVINSMDGRDNTEDERHQLYQDFLRFVSYFKPDFFVMENVKGMKSAENSEGKKVVDVINKEIENIGYNASFQILDSANFGVPQNRERLFFIGNNIEKENPNLKNWETHRKPKNEKEKKIKFKNNSNFPTFEKDKDKKPWNTVADAILDLPPVVSDGQTPPTKKEEYTIGSISEYQEWARDIDENWEDSKLYNHECRGHNMRDLTIYKLLGEGVTYKIGDLPEEHQPFRTDIFQDKIKKQNPKEPSSTVIAHLHKDGHMFVHPTEARSITVREAARLQ